MHFDEEKAVELLIENRERMPVRIIPLTVCCCVILS